MADSASERLEQLKHELEREESELDQIAKDAQFKKKAVIEKLLRIERAPATANMCLDCWVDDGAIRIREPIPADDPTRFDRWLCRSCGCYLDVPTGLR